MRVAVVGATGLVGGQLLRLLDERGFPVDGDPVVVASPRSAGRRLRWKDRQVTVQALTEEVFDRVDVALFSAGAERSRRYAPVAADAGAVVVDNSSAWRRDPDVPLVVAEVNPDALDRRPKRIVANPNCTTMILMVAAGPLHAAFGLTDMVVCTYQSVGGEGRAAIDELVDQTRTLLGDIDGLRDDGARVEQQTATGRFSRPVAFNVLAHCGDLQPDRYTVEEHKLIDESRRILDLPDLRVSPTNVRVPVVVGHCLAARLTFQGEVTRDQAVDVLHRAGGLRVVDGDGHDGQRLAYPTPMATAGRDEVLVGRIREDPYDPRSINLFVAGDNLLKGAALNTVQLAELITARAR